MQSQHHAKYHFKNQYDDYSQGAAEPHIENHTIKVTSNITAKLAAKWEFTLEELKNWRSTDYSVYTGTAGIGLLFLRKSPDDVHNLRNIRKNYLQLEQLKNRRITFLCGDAGPLAIATVISYKLEDRKIFDFCTRKLMAFVKVVNNISSDLPNEYLYGRSGFLYALLYVNKHVSPPAFSDTTIRSIITDILCVGEKLAKRLKIEKDCPLMYEWHDSKYLGAAHGISGIIYLLLQARKYLTEEELTTIIKPTIAFISTLRFPTGNFPSSLGPGRQDKYVQWCHGAPGFLYMYCEAYRFSLDVQNRSWSLVLSVILININAIELRMAYNHFKNELVDVLLVYEGFLHIFSNSHQKNSMCRVVNKTFGDKHYLYLAEKCADVIWFRGILRKGYSLCHGVAGNAYCFLEMFQTTKEPKYLYRAIRFAEYCMDYTKQKEEYSPDRPMSLFEGISGPMYLLLDIQDPLNAKFPGFTL